MARIVKVTLNWELYITPEELPQRAGIYMVIAGRKGSDGKWGTSTYKLLDIGQSGESGIRLEDHERKPCWERNKPSNSAIIYKFEPMSSVNYDETDRRIVERCLRSHTKPLCGTECNEGYNREDTVSIANTGKYSPLEESYSCGP